MTEREIWVRLGQAMPPGCVGVGLAIGGAPVLCPVDEVTQALDEMARIDCEEAQARLRLATLEDAISQCLCEMDALEEAEAAAFAPGFEDVVREFLELSRILPVESAWRADLRDAAQARLLRAGGVSLPR